MGPYRTVEVFAPAKINLALHVTGQRADGYHLIDSLVSFASVGDSLTVARDGDGRFRVTGPFAGDLAADGTNFVLQVAALFNVARTFSFTLHKNLPVASGIGGGSADAAACYRAIKCLLGDAGDSLDAPAEDLEKLLTVGADIPMCLRSKDARVQGIGEQVSPWQGVPELSVVLVNPGIGVSTPDVFKALKNKNNPPMQRRPETFGDRAAFLDWLADQRNDLQDPACTIAPVIAEVIERIGRADGCALARMSGSGATCFGLFGSAADAEAAARAIRADNPSWWVEVCKLDGGRHAAPQLIRSTT